MTDTMLDASDLKELQQSVSDFLARFAGSDTLRASLSDPAAAETLWASVVDQLALQATAIPEEFGGVGLGPVEQGLAAEEIGRRLAGGPLLGSAVAATNVVLRSAESDTRTALLEGLASGETVAALAISEDSWSQGARNPRTTAVRGSDGWSVDGEKTLVLDGTVADVLLVTAATDDGPGIFVVRSEDLAEAASEMATLDLTRRFARVGIASARASALAVGADALRVLDEASGMTNAYLAAEQTGAAQGALDLTLSFLSTRVQFGRSLASFQALKHRCADMHTAIELSRALAASAARLAANENWDRLAIIANIARFRSNETLLHVAREAVQLHGGMGYTWEADPHLYLKRAYGNRHLFGDETEIRDAAFERLIQTRQVSESTDPMKERQ